MKYITALIVCIGLLAFTGCKNHDSPARPDHHDHNGHDHVMAKVFSISAHHVYYQLNHWRIRHFHDHHSAHHFINEMQHLGCSVRTNGNNVYYMCHHERVRNFHSHHDANNFRHRMQHLGFHCH